MKIVFVSATKEEILPFQIYLKEHYLIKNDFQFTKAGLDVHLLITGVGLTMTTYALTKYIVQLHPNYVINIGIAGAFKNSNLKIGDVVQVRKTIFGDLGIEQANGDFQSAFESNLVHPNQMPFNDGVLENPNAPAFLKDVVALSVNKVHGNPHSIASISEKLPADIETMESAAIFYTCLLENVPFIEVRAISNVVEKRDKTKWNIPVALQNLTLEIIKLLGLMEDLNEMNKRQPAGFTSSRK